MKRLILLLAVFCSVQLSAQRNCGTDDLYQLQIENDPFLEQRMDDIEKATLNFIGKADKTTSGLITIPVVVHVVYNRRQASQNVSDQRIFDQIEVLNEDFSNNNVDKQQLGDTWYNFAADVQVQFCLATVDPSGVPTTGIIRKKTNKQSFSYSNDGVKFNNQGGSNAWASSDYLNIWVCNLSNGLLGYAQFPGGNAATDGVVVDYAYFGTTGATSPFNLGRTTTHEVGHWLNLRHIWGDGGCTIDDFVGDTPPSDNPNYGCALSHHSCAQNAFGRDMVENYMDYSDDACMNLFTIGQKTRMQSLFAPGGARASIAFSNGCNNAPLPTCNDQIQNGDETGVDCGGSVCDPCNTTPGVCVAPTNLRSNPKKSGREATISWDAVSGAIDYTVEIRSLPSGVWSPPFTTSSTSVKVTGLTKGVSYEWRVVTNCIDLSSASASSTFTAGSRNRTSNLVFNTIYPNPSKGYTILEIDALEQENVSIEVFDLSGRAVFSQSTNIETGVNQITIELQNIEAGNYFIRVYGEHSNLIEKLIIQH